MSYLIYLFNRDESATVMNVPVARIQSADITELSDELMREIYITVAKFNDDVVSPETIVEWDAQYVADELWNKYCYLFDCAAIVPADVEAAIEKFGNKMLDHMGDDSACYQAAADFGDYLHDLAIQELDFPDGSEE